MIIGCSSYFACCLCTVYCDGRSGQACSYPFLVCVIFLLWGSVYMSCFLLWGSVYVSYMLLLWGSVYESEWIVDYISSRIGRRKRETILDLYIHLLFFFSFPRPPRKALCQNIDLVVVHCAVLHHVFLPCLFALLNIEKHFTSSFISSSYDISRYSVLG